MNVFVFDIETVPDVETGRQLYGHPDEMAELDPKGVERVMLYERNRNLERPVDMVKLHLQKIVAISGVFRFNGHFKGEKKDTLDVLSLGNAETSEQDLIRQFFGAINKYASAQPSLTLVSWNGGGFDLPVLHYRALKYGINASHYWKVNYAYRYGSHHIDLMDKLANYQPSAFASLDEIASMLGFPGKMGMSGSKVWDTYLDGGIQEIRDYCETDVLNTFLVYLQFEMMRGHLTPEVYEQECNKVRQFLEQSDKAHLKDFLNAWNS
ncbi:ribonuclease H-like domain-containing protein [Candidatus Albibeggiatoa sp. nov. NOAA]|uniref:3'-5' exonuclease n=1 Tax=Candidatus Albibeggiatoa sp. nov. NOAA TaxID=3162724 RepID=UPI003300489A|nr:ribonuclease H-like domain-containing protein [Thiotrichaceae bacterium]